MTHCFQPVLRAALAQWPVNSFKEDLSALGTGPEAMPLRTFRLLGQHHLKALRNLLASGLNLFCSKTPLAECSEFPPAYLSFFCSWASNLSRWKKEKRQASLVETVDGGFLVLKEDGEMQNQCRQQFPDFCRHWLVITAFLTGNLEGMEMLLPAPHSPC